MKRLLTVFSLTAAMAFLLASNCDDGGDTTVDPVEEKMGTLQISYSSNIAKSGRSDAVWLETTDSTFVKTVFVSDWIRTGGALEYSDVINSRWQTSYSGDPNAVAAATPTAGSQTTTIEIPTDFSPGTYLYMVEIMLMDSVGTNFIAAGEIEIGSDQSQSSATLIQDHTGFSDALSNVSATYTAN
ncbi:MAG: hypothetical protein GF401_12340 [Chitinivibrionales bacterium]|nr:hypothetical protein [Chitinivibrionales bacterium]